MFLCKLFQSVFPPQTSGLSWYHPSAAAFQQFQLPDNTAIFATQPPYKTQQGGQGGGGGGRGGHNQYKSRRGRGGGGGQSNDRQQSEQRGNGYPNQGFQQQSLYSGGQPQQPQHPQHPQAAPSPPQQYNSYNYYGGQRSGGRPSLDGGSMKKYSNNGMPPATTSAQYHQPQVMMLHQAPSPQVTNAPGLISGHSAVPTSAPAVVSVVANPAPVAPIPVASVVNDPASSHDNLSKPSNDATGSNPPIVSAATPPSQDTNASNSAVPPAGPAQSGYGGHRHNRNDDGYHGSGGFSSGYHKSSMESLPGKEMQRYLIFFSPFFKTWSRFYFLQPFQPKRQAQRRNAWRPLRHG